MFQDIVGNVQLVSGLLKKKPKRPDMKTPASVTEATNIARQQANASVRPGNDIALNNIRQSTSNAVGATRDVSGSASDVLAAVGRANTTEQDAVQQNNMLNANYTNQARRNLIGQLNHQGQYEQMGWENNKLARYKEDKADRARLINEGIKNKSQAESQVMESATSIISSFLGGGGGGGAMSMLSDERTKEDIAPLDTAIDKVLAMNVVTFKYKGSTDKHIGFIAQELKEIIPESVFTINMTEEEERLAVDMAQVVPVLVKAIQEQQLALEDLKRSKKTFDVVY